MRTGAAVAADAGGALWRGLAVAWDSEVPPQGAVPEPMTLVLFGVGLAGLGLVRRRR
jgi:hypothetical protein